MPKYTERTIGIYRCRFLGTEERDMTNPETNVEEARWIWKFQELSDPTSAGQIDKITGTSLKSPNSNAYKMASGIMGRKLQADDDTDTKIGQDYDVVYGPNQAGNLTITGVMPIGVHVQTPTGILTATPAPEPLSQAENGSQAGLPTGDLPF